jgi:hypothetical protein
MVLKILLTLSLSFQFVMCSNEENSTHDDKNVIENNNESDSLDLSENVIFSCDYMGQKPPGEIPVKFMPGIVSTKEDDSCFEISISGKEMVFNRAGKIYITKQENNGAWTVPKALFEGGESSFSKDGQMIYFNSRASISGSKVALNVWYSKKLNDIWQNPSYLSGEVMNQVMHAPSLNVKGDMYASGITLQKFEADKFLRSEKLHPPIKGSHPFISFNDRYIIFDKRPPSGGYAADLYISYRLEENKWSNPVWMNTNINTDKAETNAYVTPDGKFMFFTRNFDIYWVKADFISNLEK